MQTFASLSSWSSYRRILAEEFGLHLQAEPIERQVLVRGHRLRIDHWGTEGPPKGTVLLIHGGGGNGRILAPFAEPIAQHGWQVLAPDLPGFGLSEPSPRFDWDYAEWPAVISAIADAQSGPVVLMGASLGGMAAVFGAQQSEQVAGVVATTLLDLSVEENFIQVARWPWLGRLSLFGMNRAPDLLDRLRIPLRLATPLAMMSANRRMQRYFATDPLIGASWKPVKFFRTVQACKPRSLRLDCPLLLVHPGADVWTPTELSLSVFGQVDAEKVFVELSNGSHLPVEQPAYRELAEHVTTFLDRLAV